MTASTMTEEIPAQAVPVPDHLLARPAARFLTVAQMKVRWNCTERWLSDLRRSGNGPHFLKQGGFKPIYETEDVLRYEMQHLRTSTSVA